MPALGEVFDEIEKTEGPSWLQPGHVLDKTEVEFLRHLRIVDDRDFVNMKVARGRLLAALGQNQAGKVSDDALEAEREHYDDAVEEFLSHTLEGVL